MQTLSFPELRQIYNYDCGACAVCCVLAYYGLDVREEWVMQLAKTNSDEGTPINGIISVFDYFGFSTDHGTKDEGMLCNAIDNGFPTIITLQAYRSENKPYSECWNDGHYVVAIGYDRSKIYFEDPSSYKRTWLSRKELFERWHDVDNGEKIYWWGCTVQGEPKYVANDATHMD